MPKSQPEPEEGSTKPQKTRDQLRRHNRRKANIKWVTTIVIWTFVISGLFTYISQRTMSDVGILFAILIICAFILIGILFDIVGIAVTSADETPFHSMNARKVQGAKQSIVLIRHAEKVSNFCNDVVGDICNIISGSASTALIAYFVISGSSGLVQSLLITAIIASLTVGGKAIGKSLAIYNSERILFFVGKILCMLGVWKNISLNKKH